MTYSVNVMQGSQIEVTEDREAVLDCVSPGGKPAPDVSGFHLDTFLCLFSFCHFFSLFSTSVSFFAFFLGCVSPGGKPAPGVSVFLLDTFFGPFFVAILV